MILPDVAMAPTAAASAIGNVVLGKTNNPSCNKYGPDAQASLGAKQRLARCPSCGHAGAIPRDVPTTGRLRCVACGTAALVRQCIGPRPAIFRHHSSAQRARDVAAADVLTRYGNSGLDDPIDDLFRGGGSS